MWKELGWVILSDKTQRDKLWTGIDRVFSRFLRNVTDEPAEETRRQVLLKWLDHHWVFEQVRETTPLEVRLPTFGRWPFVARSLRPQGLIPTSRPEPQSEDPFRSTAHLVQESDDEISGTYLYGDTVEVESVSDIPGPKGSTTQWAKLSQGGWLPVAPHGVEQVFDPNTEAIEWCRPAYTDGDWIDQRADPRDRRYMVSGSQGPPRLPLRRRHHWRVEAVDGGVAWVADGVHVATRFEYSNTPSQPGPRRQPYFSAVLAIALFGDEGLLQGALAGARILGPADKDTQARCSCDITSFHAAIAARMEAGDGVPLDPDDRWLERIIWEVRTGSAEDRFLDRGYADPAMRRDPVIVWVAPERRHIESGWITAAAPLGTRSPHAEICGYLPTQFVKASADPLVAMHRAVELWQLRARLGGSGTRQPEIWQIQLQKCRGVDIVDLRTSRACRNAGLRPGSL
eukprot:gene1909-613_t